jgi:polyphosphate kinase 2 (PPK2 family)
MVMRCIAISVCVWRFAQRTRGRDEVSWNPAGARTPLRCPHGVYRGCGHELQAKIGPAEGAKVALARFDANDTLGFKKGAKVTSLTRRAVARLDELQNLLWADKRRALLIILQAMDTGGKDGTIRHVMSGVNPQGCRVTSFKTPAGLELSHDFLWRVHQAVPAKGGIAIFNRSH